MRNLRAGAAPLLVGVGLAYFGVLAVSLILWHMSPTLVLSLTVGAIALVMIAFRPYWGVQVFVLILFFEHLANIQGGMTVMQVLGAILVCGWLLNAAMKRKAPLRPDAFTVTVILFLLWCGATLPGALDVGAGFTRLLTFVQMAVAAFMFASVVDDRDKARGVYVAIVFWSFLTTCVALRGYYSGVTSGAVGLVGNRNLVAVFINCATVAATLLFQSSREKRTRILLALSLPILFLTLGLTFSRTGLIVQCLSLLLVWYRVVRERAFLLLAGSALAVTVITLVLPMTFYKRASTIVPSIERQQGTFGARVQIWKAGIRMIQDRPIFGIGPGNFTRAVQRYSRGDVTLAGLSAHNAYISLAAETGLVGAGLFVALLLVALAETRRAQRAARLSGAKDIEMFAVINEISLLGMMIHGITGSVEGLKFLWLLMGMSLAVGRLVPARSDARPEAPLIPQEHEGPWKLAPGDLR